MRIAFYYNTVAGYESLGIESLSAVLKAAGHQVMLVMDTTNSGFDVLNIRSKLSSLIDGGISQDKLIEMIKTFKPDLICYSVFTDNYAQSIHTACALKERLGSEIINIFGGIHATSVPEVVMKNSFIDFVMIGESEISLLQFIDAMEGRKALEDVPNLVYRNNTELKRNSLSCYIRDIDSLPFPDKDLFYDKIPVLSKDYYIMTGRGCPYKCTYCCNSISHALYKHEKNHIRKRSIENVIGELLIAKKKFNPKLVSFMDDIFALKPNEWLYPFLEEYTKIINIPYYCQIHPNHITSEIVSHLARSNCWNVTIGIQSGSPRIREQLFKRKTSNKDIIDSCKDIKNKKIFLTVDIILGIPTETIEELDLTLDLLGKIMPDRITNFYLAYYPETELTKNAFRLNYLSEDIKEAYENGMFMMENFVLRQPGEYSIVSDKRRCWIYQSKMQLLCIFKSLKFSRFASLLLEKIPTYVLVLLGKSLSIFASLKNFDKRAYQRLSVDDYQNK